jgi:hypothetical protein
MKGVKEKCVQSFPERFYSIVKRKSFYLDIALWTKVVSITLSIV